jgi:transposase InsO family protein
MRFRFIEDRRADYPVRILCEVLEVSPAGYYAWRSRPDSRRSAANRELVDDIQQVHREAYGRYGSPRIHAELRAQGRRASRGRIERLMRHHGIRAIMARPRRARTTDSRHDFPIAANLLERNFTATAPNRIWLADITYVETDQGWLYLAAVPLQPKDRRLGNVRSLARRPAVGSLADGHLGAAAWRRPDPPFRSRRAIRFGGVSQAAAIRRLPSLDEPQRRLL